MSNRDIDELEARIAKGERRSLLRTSVISVIPVAAAVVFLLFTLQQIESAGSRLEKVRSELETAQVEIERANEQREAAIRIAEAAAEERDEMLALRERAEEEVQQYVDRAAQLQNQIASLEQESKQYQERYQEQLERSRALAEELAEVTARLEQAVAFQTNVYDLDWTDVKDIASRMEEAGELLVRIDEFRQEGVTWGLDNTIAGGFTSPGFAGFILQQMQGQGTASYGATLSNLETRRGSPQLGDVVLYESGYAMFYMQDYQGTPFVVGMTPIGILALEFEFGPKILEVRNTGLQR